MLACRLRHLGHSRDSRDRSKCQPPNTLYSRSCNACIFCYWGKLLLLRGDDTLIIYLRAGPFQESRQAIAAQGRPTLGSTHRLCPADGNIAGKPLRDLVQAGQALSALSADVTLVVNILCIGSLAFPGQTMHLHAHPHVAGQLCEQLSFPARLGAEIDLLDADGWGAMLALIFFESFKECEGRNEPGGWERKVEDCRRFRRGYWERRCIRGWEGINLGEEKGPTFNCRIMLVRE